ncbi:MAG: hypothetical protein ABWZ25_12035 [Chitinophagaceae bacterium]
MNIYLTKADAIVDMHERGYINDFQLSGNDLLWVQGKVFLRARDFAILEYHRFSNPKRVGADLILFGVISLLNEAKGILLNDHSHRRPATPPVIEKKLNELNISMTC